jgi:transcriptional regulator with XRE-family HTH domain
MKDANGGGWTHKPATRHAGSVDESRQWEEFGRWLVEQREERGLRRRDAARKAKISEAAWRDLETGRKEAIGGIRLLPNPSKELLSRVAAALELPVEDLLTRIGRSARTRSNFSRSSGGDGHETDDDGALLLLKLKRLSDRDRHVVESLVDSLLEAEGP